MGTIFSLLDSSLTNHSDCIQWTFCCPCNALISKNLPFLVSSLAEKCVAETNPRPFLQAKYKDKIVAKPHVKIGIFFLYTKYVNPIAASFQKNNCCVHSAY